MPKNVKIPKKIAGVKIPKKARKTANKAIKMGANPVVRELAAAAIGAAGARAAAERGDRKDEGREEHREESRSGYRAEIHVDGARVAEAFRAAAIDGLRRFLEGFEEGLRNIREAAEDEEPADPEPASGARPGAG
jgi:hypothetical protein